MTVIAPADVEAILGRALTDIEYTRVDRLTEMAEAALEDALPGFTLTAGHETAEVWGRGDRTIGYDGTIWTPRYPVTAIASVNVLALTVPPIGYRWNEHGRIVFAPQEDWQPIINAPWLARGFTPYTVTYSYGFASVPADICSAIAAPIAALLRQQKANPDDLSQESIGSYSVRYHDRGETDPGSMGPVINMLVKAQLRRWRRTRDVSVTLARHL